MSIELPGFLTEALSYIGMDWPQADEDKLFEAASAWGTFAGQLREVESSTSSAAADIWSVNSGAAVEAFQTWWDAQPRQHLLDDASGSEAIGTTLTIFGTATIALKGVYLVQLGILAATLIQAAATAFVTFGASLAEIPIVSQIVRQAIETAIENMIFEILF
ncbi:WXG100-like domain-containing protein [Jatrophihabitans sp. YIM 134969]